MVVRELSARDAEVRAHEQAHIAASGGMAGSPSYSYQQGPDGKRYAVGGEVSISISSGSTPQETISRAQQVRAAALAPAQPSGQDRAVAAAASQMEQAALRQQSEERAAARPSGKNKASGGQRGGKGASRTNPSKPSTQARKVAPDASSATPAASRSASEARRTAPTAEGGVPAGQQGTTPPLQGAASDTSEAESGAASPGADPAAKPWMPSVPPGTGGAPVPQPVVHPMDPSGAAVSELIGMLGASEVNSTPPMMTSTPAPDDVEDSAPSEVIPDYGGKQASGVVGHRHMALACPFCQRAVSAYSSG